MPQQTYGETKLWDLARGKAKIGEGETKWGEFVERLSVLFGGERKYDWKGMEWTSSELSTISKLGRLEERGLPLGETLGAKSKIEKVQGELKETLDEEVGGVEDQTKVNDTGPGFLAPAVEGEGYGETQGFGSNFLGQSNQKIKTNSKGQKYYIGEDGKAVLVQ